MAATNAAQLSRLVAANEALTTQAAKLNERVGELLAAARRRQRPPTTPAPPAPPPIVTADAQRAFDQRPAPPTLPPKTKPAAKPHRPSGRKPVPAHLAAETHQLRPDACAHCGGGALDAADVVVEEK